MAGSGIQNWLNYVDFKRLKTLAGFRDIYIWGACEQSAYIADACERHEIAVAGFVETKKALEVYRDKTVIRENELRSGLQFIIVPMKKELDQIVGILLEKKFLFNEDFIAVHNHYSINFSGGYYEDVYGNKIISKVYGESVCCKIEFKGYNNVVMLGSGINFQDVEIFCWYGSTVKIEDGCRLIKTSVKCVENSSLFIDKNCSFGNDCQFISKSSLQIGKDCTIQCSGFIGADYDSPISIGDDCMFSWPVYIRSNNSHALLDLVNEENTSVSKKHYVRIGNHVWIGQNVTVLFNTDIGDHAVIGAASLVNSVIPSNCIAAGNPARVIKENYSWARKAKITFEEFQELSMHILRL
ncbi:acyltransferase [Hungatella hathewayi]|uniref:acyltransferase n=1 Tax=Hungatella hathewayi TaxID=154046 RepID=UPI003563E7D8